ncbi:MAG: hypothetical protein ACK5Y8_02720, partial [Betaproteobacteria bacterium]
ASHYLLDTRFMIAWARALHASGDEAAARHLVARLREFRRPDAAGFFAPCAAPASAAAAFQCQPPPQLPLSWRAFAPPEPESMPLRPPSPRSGPRSWPARGCRPSPCRGRRP